jgi:hypothetical protein
VLQLIGLRGWGFYCMQVTVQDREDRSLNLHFHFLKVCFSLPGVGQIEKSSFLVIDSLKFVYK